MDTSSKNSTKRLRIGQVSKQTGVAVGALRYYEELGLLTAMRGKNGYRYYPPSAVQQVNFIKKAQSLGFSLEDIHQILTVHQKGNVPCDLVQSLLQEKIEQLESQIQEMLSFKHHLMQYQDSWASTQPRPKPGDICPLIETVPIERSVQAKSIS